MRSLSVSILMKATEQEFLVLLFVVLYKVTLTSESVKNLRNSYELPFK